MHLGAGGQLRVLKAERANWVAFGVFCEGAFLDYGSLGEEAPDVLLTLPLGMIEIRTVDADWRMDSRFVDLRAGQVAEVMIGD
ncbi:MAG: hypothetical protein ACI8QC_003437 [Planctomycetota bacterium]|jgi:hypothetical protein